MIARHPHVAGFAAAILLALTLVAMPAARATTYSIIDLGTLAPRGVNSLGQVVGDYRLWSGGVLVDLRPFINRGAAPVGTAWDINDAGQILTQASYSIGSPCGSSNNFTYGTLGIIQNGVLTCGSSLSPLPGRINSAGKAAFTEANAGGPIAHVWDPQSGITTTLPVGPEPPGPFAGSRSAYDINDLDQVVGKSPNHALLWEGNVVTDLGQLIGSAVAIGNGSQIAINNYSPSLGGNAYLWDAGVLTTIGQFGPTDINASAQAVGAQQVSGVSHAVLWESNLVTDLNDLLPPASGWVLNTAARISDNGYITGSGTLNGQARGFLLVPDTISQQQANLAVTVTSSPPGPWSSGPVTADITVVNNGPDTATGATLIASYDPEYFTPNGPPTPSQGSCITNQWNNSRINVWCALGSLASGASATLQFTSNFGIIGTTAVGASAHAIELDTVSADNAASATLVRATADLSVVASDSPDPVLAGQALTYTVVVTNNGPDTAGNASLRSSTPSGTTHVSAVSSQGSCSGTSLINCTFGDLPSGGSATVQIVSTPTVGPSVSRSFLGLTTSVDPVSGNSSATVVTTVTPVPIDLALALTDTPDPAYTIAIITYTATVTNNGPVGATGVTVSGGVDGEGRPLPNCNLGTVAAGASASCTLLAVSPTSAGTFSQIMTVAATESDPNPANNSATASTTIQVRPPADVALTISDTPDPVALGGTVTYILTAANSGPSAATNVTVSGSPGSLATCNLGTIAAGASTSCTRTAVANSAGTLSQTMTAVAAEPDPNLGNNTATATTTVLNPPADLALTLSDAPDPVFVGGTVTYTATVTNNSAGIATGVTVSGSLATCGLGTLAAGASASCTRTAVASAAGTLSQTMSVAAAESDPNTGNNSATTTTTVLGGADLAVTITDSPDPVKKGRRLTYTVVVSNGGPLSATGVALSVVLPANITFESKTSSQGTCTGNATVNCALGSLSNGSSATVTIKIKPKSAGTKTSTASVTGTTTDPNGANNAATATTTVTN